MNVRAWPYSGLWHFHEEPTYGTLVSRPVWLPMIPEEPPPLYPEAIGHLLREILHPTPRTGPPWTHTFSLPRTRYDTDGEPLPEPVQPSLTVTQRPPAAFNREPYEKLLAALRVRRI